MVKPYDIAQEKAVKILKFRIKHHEFHGNGKVAMEDKTNLLKLERKIKIRKEKK